MHSGITRRELLVVLVIVSLGIAVGIPGVSHLRESARKGSCKNNLRSLGIAFDNYYATFGTYPYGCVGNPAFEPERRWSWSPPLAPWLAQHMAPPINQLLPSDVRESIPWEYEMTKDPNDGAMTVQFGAMTNTLCPNANDSTDEFDQPLATYVGMAGIGDDAATCPAAHRRAGMWGYDRQTKRDDVADGREHTIFVIETAHGRGSWYRGGPATVRGVTSDGTNVIGADAQFGGFHSEEAGTGLLGIQSSTVVKFIRFLFPSVG